MTIEWEELVTKIELMEQRITLLEAAQHDTVERLKADAILFQTIMSGSSDTVETLTEAQETISALGNLVDQSHKAIMARISQCERVNRRHDNQIKTIPGVVTRLVSGEKKHRALSLKVADVDQKVEDEIRERKKPAAPARL